MRDRVAYRRSNAAGGEVELAAPWAEAHPDLPEQVWLVLGQQVLHHDQVRGGMPASWKTTQRRATGTARWRVPDLDQAVRTARDYVTMSRQAMVPGSPGDLSSLLRGSFSQPFFA